VSTPFSTTFCAKSQALASKGLEPRPPGIARLSMIATPAPRSDCELSDQERMRLYKRTAPRPADDRFRIRLAPYPDRKLSARESS